MSPLWLKHPTSPDCGTASFEGAMPNGLVANETVTTWRDRRQALWVFRAASRDKTRTEPAQCHPQVQTKFQTGDAGELLGAKSAAETVKKKNRPLHGP